jgi:hypothetical protein
VLVLALAMLQPIAVCATDVDSATEKLEQDMKTAVLNGSITIAQVKQLQASAATLKAAKAERQPGAPVDLLTPYLASSMNAGHGNSDAEGQGDAAGGSGRGSGHKADCNTDYDYSANAGAEAGQGHSPRRRCSARRQKGR